MLQSSYFSRVTSSTQQLLCWSSYFFRAATFLEQLFFFLSSYSFKIVTSQQTIVGLQNVFSVTIFRLPRRLKNVLKASWKTKNCYVEDFLKTFLQDVFETCLQDIFKSFTGNVYWEYLYLQNLKSVPDKFISHVSNLTNQGESKMH